MVYSHLCVNFSGVETISCPIKSQNVDSDNQTICLCVKFSIAHFDTIDMFVSVKAMKFLQDNNVAHMDLKPQNILLSSTSNLTLKIGGKVNLKCFNSGFYFIASFVIL